MVCYGLGINCPIEIINVESLLLQWDHKRINAFIGKFKLDLEKVRSWRKRSNEGIPLKVCIPFPVSLSPCSLAAMKLAALITTSSFHDALPCSKTIAMEPAIYRLKPVKP